MNRRKQFAAIALFAAAAACRHPKTDPVAAVGRLEGVEVAGCDSLATRSDVDPTGSPWVCRVGENRTIRVFVPASVSDVEIRGSAGITSTIARKWSEGVRYEVRVPKGAALLEVIGTEGGVRRRYGVPVAEPPQVAAFVAKATELRRAGDLDGAIATIEAHAVAALCHPRPKIAAPPRSRRRSRSVIAGSHFARAVAIARRIVSNEFST